MATGIDVGINVGKGVGDGGTIVSVGVGDGVSTGSVAVGIAVGVSVGVTVSAETCVGISCGAPVAVSVGNSPGVGGSSATSAGVGVFKGELSRTIGSTIKLLVAVSMGEASSPDRLVLALSALASSPLAELEVSKVGVAGAFTPGKCTVSGVPTAVASPLGEGSGVEVIVPNRAI